jgi:Flp pilus assembly protein TadG
MTQKPPEAERRNVFTDQVSKEKGSVLIEFCFILPVLAMMIFGVIDFGRLIEASLVITNVSREGADLFSRDIKSGSDLLDMLQSSATPLDLNGMGKVYVTTVLAGTSNAAPNPFIDTTTTVSRGNLSVASSVSSGAGYLGLTQALYNHLVYNDTNKTADILGVAIVEVYYKYQPITPLPSFIANMLLQDGDGTVLGNKAVFCITGAH